MTGDQSESEFGAWGELTVAQRYQRSVGASAGEVAGRRGTVMEPYRLRLIFTDALIVVAVMALGLGISSRASSWAIDPLLAIYGTPIAIGSLWMAMLALRGSYDQRVIGLGTEEIRRVVSATLYTFAAVAGLGYLVRADISRAYAFVSLPLGLIVIIIARFQWRGWLYRQRAKNRYLHEMLVVGSGPACEELTARLQQDAYAGYRVASRRGAAG